MFSSTENQSKELADELGAYKQPREGTAPPTSTPAGIPRVKPSASQDESQQLRELSLLSVVVPVFNELEALDELYRRLVASLGTMPFELIFTDNASTDGTAERLAEMAQADSRMRVILLSRNFGHQASLSAGLEHARGDAVAMLDGDLQDPPELLPDMVAHWRTGVDVVYMVRAARAGESRFKLTTARWFYRLLARLTEFDVPQNAGDFRLLDRRALDALLAMPERRRFLRGMSAWIGFKQLGIPYDRDARYAGETKYSLRNLVRFSLDAIASFSHVPLQLSMGAGFIVSGIALLGLPLVVILRLAGATELPGVSTILFVVLFLGGVQLITIGIIGEYLGRIYDEVKQRPLYVVHERINATSPDPSSSMTGADEVGIPPG
ncbi:MAG: polyisoprenyl-phosphate glycosyltransferase [Solirubrobacterales bacterium]|nr:polyisoprenyl-phosphate glycosyltransferase [Solirubrobacterales bacterium]